MRELAGDLPDGAESGESADELEQLARDASVPIEALLEACVAPPSFSNSDVIVDIAPRSAYSFLTCDNNTRCERERCVWCVLCIPLAPFL